MRRLLFRMGAVCIALAVLLTAWLLIANAAAPGWVATCRVAPSVEHDGELWRLRCANGEIKALDSDPAPRATADPRTPTAVIIVVTVQPYPMPYPTYPAPYPLP